MDHKGKHDREHLGVSSISSPQSGKSLVPVSPFRPRICQWYIRGKDLSSIAPLSVLTSTEPYEHVANKLYIKTVCRALDGRSHLCSCS